MTLNDFSTFVFADTLVEKYKLPLDPEQFLFPLIIQFEGNLKVKYTKVDKDGYLIKIKPTILDEYLYEQVIKIESDEIKVVFHLWKSNLKDDKPGERIILIVSANKMRLIEKQDQEWLEIFGNQFDGAYKYFKEQFNSERYVSDHNECMKLLEEYERLLQNKEKPTA